MGETGIIEVFLQAGNSLICSKIISKMYNHFHHDRLNYTLYIWEKECKLEKNRKDYVNYNGHQHVQLSSENLVGKILQVFFFFLNHAPTKNEMKELAWEDDDYVD